MRRVAVEEILSGSHNDDDEIGFEEGSGSDKAPNGERGI
jgi:hypothetical protein